TPSLAVRGVQSFLDYSLFGDGLPPSPSHPAGNSIDSFWNSGASSSGSRLNGPSSPSFFHYVKVFQSLLKRKGKKMYLWVADLLLFLARSVLRTLTMMEEPSTIR
ncbi:hypothetical protein V8G54_006482, partial [Vigna mungo]